LASGLTAHCFTRLISISYSMACPSLGEVSNFDHTASAKERMRYSGAGALEGAHMSRTDQFWQYAKEAILSAHEAKTGEDKEGLLELELELARTWTQAALQERQLVPVGVLTSPSAKGSRHVC
jgi:hypothetical protein